MKLVVTIGCAVLCIVPAKARAETLTCDAVDAIIWKDSKTILANELSIRGLSTKIDVATVKNDVDQIPALLTEMKARCQEIIDAATGAKDAVEGIGTLPSQCGSDQAQIEQIKAKLNEEIASCTAAISEVDGN